uniref:Uncharacterized protein n=1 Tax=Corethron hystrix TaxID=216773 RepID=A0A7S1FPQ7_9STRA|mmetsp:Transcript_21230/g.48210  ORF Transcript_21230/g.48210 Transcript_21230/m.48210 type:complete len:482 (+) Transcript_21230:429-1874(+)
METEEEVSFALMKFDKYYASVDETESMLSYESEQLLRRGNDMISFFQICGPAYVRGHRRTSEILIVFRYEATSTEGGDRFFKDNLEMKVKSYAMTDPNGVDGVEDFDIVDHDQRKMSELLGGYEKNKGSSQDKIERVVKEWIPKDQRKKYTYFSVDFPDNAASAEIKQSPEKFSSLDISVKGYGIDLEGAEDSLAAVSFDDLEDVIQNAYGLLINPNVGVIVSIEVVPWANNYQFEMAAGIGKIIVKEDGAQSGKVFSDFLKKLYLGANAEFIVRMDQEARDRSNKIFLLAQCQTFLYRLSKLELCHTAIRHKYELYNTATYDALKTFTLTNTTGNNGDPDWSDQEKQVIQAGRLLYLLEGRAEGKGLYNEASSEHIRWMTEVYAPCMNRLSMPKYHNTYGTLVSTHWMDHQECMGYVVCHMRGAVRTENGCVYDGSILQTDWIGLVDSFCMPYMEFDVDLMWGDKCNLATDEEAIFGEGR